MKNIIKNTFVIIVLCTTLFCANDAQCQYNNLFIPDTLSGKNFNLNIKDTFSQIVKTGQQTITGGINNKFWGPTLFFNDGDTVRMNVHNYLNDSTTLHWHGMHLPAVMDGGPHQIIPPGTIWQPYWKVNSKAATFWYHPHLHEMAMEQITKGIGGFIIVRDATEAALALPRKYGVDDIPLALTDRSFNTTDNSFKIVPYGDSMMVNGTLRPQFTIPAQVVRLRLLNAAIERSYNIGFSDNRTFYIIASDGGLLNAPVAVTSYILHVGERIEILVNCSGQNGTSIDLKAYNSLLAGSIAGGETFTTGPFGNALGHKDFTILHLNIGSATSSPITAIPSVLTTNTLLNSASASITRNLTITDSAGAGATGPNYFVLNRKLFNIKYNEYNVPLNNTEIWQITSSSIFGHPFHIHDVEFNILSVNGVAPVAAQAGLKDVVFIPAATRTPGPSGTTTPTVVKFIAKFDDFADSLHPFMYHCHIALHEDEGMMGQFIVTNTISLPVNLLSFTAKVVNNAALLNWETSNQVNTKWAVVQRSENGIHWLALDSLPATNSGTCNYEYIDSLPSNGTNYYRIMFEDTDGKQIYSNVNALQFNTSSFQFSIFPNPAKTKLYFNFPDPTNQVYYLRLTNLLGRTIYMLPQPQLQNGIDISNLANGTYILQVTDSKSKKTVTKQFVKLKD